MRQLFVHKHPKLPRNKGVGHDELVVEPTHLKNMLVKLDHFPRLRGEYKKYLKPPPRQQYHPFD